MVKGAVKGKRLGQVNVLYFKIKTRERRASAPQNASLEPKALNAGLWTWMSKGENILVRARIFNPFLWHP